MRHENVSGSFETPSYFRNVHTFHELGRKEGRNSFGSYWCMSPEDIYEQKGMKSYEMCVHTRNEGRSPEKRAFLDSSHERVWAYVQHESLCCFLQIEFVRTHSVFVLHVFLPLLPSFHTTFQYTMFFLKCFTTFQHETFSQVRPPGPDRVRCHWTGHCWTPQKNPARFGLICCPPPKTPVKTEQ
jgi:hypothetical protein